MNIAIVITFISRGIRVQRKGSFQKRGRTPEKVATDWIYEIKKEMDVEKVLKVEADGVDITTSIMEWRD